MKMHGLSNICTSDILFPKIDFLFNITNYKAIRSASDYGYSLELPRRGDSNEYHNLCFEQKYRKYQNFYLKTFSVGW